MLSIIQFVAAFASSLFAGAAIYINLVEHPARMGCSTEIAATQWAPSYERATIMQASLALISFLSGISAWFLGSGSAETRALLVKWGNLHAIRSLLGLIASAIFIWQLVGT